MSRVYVGDCRRFVSRPRSSTRISAKVYGKLPPAQSAFAQSAIEATVGTDDMENDRWAFRTACGRS